MFTIQTKGSKRKVVDWYSISTIRKTFLVPYSHKQNPFYVVCPHTTLFLCYLYLLWNGMRFYGLFSRNGFCRSFHYKSWWMNERFVIFRGLKLKARICIIFKDSVNSVLLKKNVQQLKTSNCYLYVSLGWKEPNPYNKCLVKFGKLYSSGA